MKKTIVVTFELDIAGGHDSPEGRDVEQYLARLTTQHPGSLTRGWTVGNPTVFIDAPRIVCGIEGGIVQGSSSEVPAEVVIVDYDGDAEDAIAIPQSDGSIASAWVYGNTAECDPAWVEDIWITYNAANDESDNPSQGSEATG